MKGNQSNDEYVYYECGECGAEVSIDDKICPKCGADISEIDEEEVEELPDEMKIKWKPLQSLPGSIYAEMVKEVFDKKGIPSLIKRSPLSSAYGLRGDSGDETTIFVPEDRFEECTEIINQMLNHI